MAREFDVNINLRVLAQRAQDAINEFNTSVRRSTNVSFGGTNRQLRELQARADAAGRSFTAVGRQLSLSLTAPLTLLGGLAVRNFGVQENAVRQLETALESTGNTAGFTSEQLQDVASSIQQNSTFGDEDILENVTTSLTRFASLTGDTFLQAQQVIIDFAARTGRDLSGASQVIGRALEDPIDGLTQLARVGVSFSDGQEDVIRQLVETGRTAEAQGILIGALEDRFQGAASVAASFGTGPLRQLINAFNDALEPIGRVILEALNPFILQLTALAQGFSNATPEFQRIVTIFGALAAAIGPALIAIGGILPVLTRIIGPSLSLASTLSSVASAFGTLFGVVARFGVIGLVVTAIIDIQREFNVLTDLFPGISGFFAGLGENFISFDTLSGFLVNSVRAVVSVFTDFTRFVSGGLALAFNAIIIGFATVVQGVNIAVFAVSDSLLVLARNANRLPGINIDTTALESIRSAIVETGNEIDDLSSRAQESFTNVATTLAQDNIEIELSVGNPDLSSLRETIDGIETEIQVTTQNTNNNAGNATPQLVMTQLEIDTRSVESLNNQLEAITNNLSTNTSVAIRTIADPDDLASTIAGINQRVTPELNEISDRFTNLFSSISDPALRAQVEQQVSSISSTLLEISPDSALIGSFQSQLSTTLNNASQQIAQARADASDRETLTQELAGINEASRDSLLALRDNIQSAISGLSDPTLIAAARTQIGSINQELSNLNPVLQSTQEAINNGLTATGVAASASSTAVSTIGNSFAQVITGAQSAGDAFDELGQRILTAIANQAIQSAITSLTSSIAASADGGPTARFFREGGLISAFKDGGLIKSTIENMLSSLPKFETGGNPASVSRGRFQNRPNGNIRGPGTGRSDSILARISNGEFIHRASSVRLFGLDFMNAVNNLNPDTALSLLRNRLDNGSQAFKTGGLAVSNFNNRLNNFRLPSFEDGGQVSGSNPPFGGMNVQVNMQSNGTPQNAEVTDTSFDGQNLIMTVLLNDIRTNGQISKGISGAFGLRRRGR